MDPHIHRFAFSWQCSPIDIFHNLIDSRGKTVMASEQTAIWGYIHTTKRKTVNGWEFLRSNEKD